MSTKVRQVLLDFMSQAKKSLENGEPLELNMYLVSKTHQIVSVPIRGLALPLQAGLIRAYCKLFEVKAAFTIGGAWMADYDKNGPPPKSVAHREDKKETILIMGKDAEGTVALFQQYDRDWNTGKPVWNEEPQFVDKIIQSVQLDAVDLG